MTISAQQETVFSNNQLSVEEIPSLQTLALLPISKKYRTLNILSIGLIALVLIGIASALRFQNFWSLPEGLLQAYPYVVAGIIAVGSLWALYHFFLLMYAYFMRFESKTSVSSQG
ncbi:hypothetical protein [Alteromonas macleodii]|uniref:hypothetical protein n=1 Tax=Alteromonas macleodii TaxID=28108 RepID=UPI0022AFF9B8|nr:hypothetical protein [Alteromonas macleodii]MCZ4240897.1 hypothetical protein [Alteromonas macleodii]